MRTLLRYSLILAAIVITAAACGSLFDSSNDSSARTIADLQNDPRFTADDVHEAQVMAAYLTAELYGPEELAVQIALDLKPIREQHEYVLQNPHDEYWIREHGLPPDSIPSSVRFRPQWVSGVLYVELDPDAKPQLVNGEDERWNDLADRFQLRETTHFIANWHVLRFDDLSFHPWRAAEEYRLVEGVTNAEVFPVAGDFSTIYPLMTSGGMRYLFRWGGGDCPAGCTIEAFWYFTASDGELTFHGYAGPVDHGAGDWWEDARECRDAYLEHALKGTRPPVASENDGS